MKRLIATIAAILLPLAALGVTVLSVDDSGNVYATGAFTGTTFTFTGDLTLANAETIDNATDGELRLTYDDDAATLGELILESDNGQANMADGDSFILRAKANDSGGTKTTYALIDLEASDVTDASEDGVIRLQLQDGGSLITVAEFGPTGMDMENGERLDNTADRFLTVSYDDDAADLGTLKLSSENAGANMSDSDHLDVVFEAKDSAGNATEFVTLEGTADDVTSATEDGSLVVKAMADGTETTVATLGGSAITLSKATTASAALTASTTLTVTGNLTANGDIIGDGSTKVTNCVLWVETYGYFTVVDTTNLVFITSGGVTNSIDSDTSS